MTFGLLSGLQTLMPMGSVLARAQTCLMMVLQFVMACFALRLLPDADRIISRFVGVQFLCEGCSTAWLLAADFLGASIASGSMTSSSFSVPQALYGAFLVQLVAMCVPIAQLIEQRAVTPTINAIQHKGGSPLALLASAYMVATSLPRQLMSLITQSGEGSGASQDDAGGASNEDGAEDNEGEDAYDQDGGAGDAAIRASQLLSRSLAAKEVAATKAQCHVQIRRRHASIPQPEASAGNLGAAMAGARFKRKLKKKRRRFQRKKQQLTTAVTTAATMVAMTAVTTRAYGRCRMVVVATDSAHQSPDMPVPRVTFVHFCIPTCQMSRIYKVLHRTFCMLFRA